MPETNQKKSNPLIWLGLGVMVGLLIWGLWKGCNPKPPISGFVPRDTIYVPNYIHDTVDKYIYIEKTNVTVYDNPPHPLPGTKVEIRYDTITKDSLIYVVRNDTIIQEFKPIFLTSYPEAPKLLRQLIYKDSITMDLFWPNGKVYSGTYPMDLDRYNYVYEHGVMKVLKGPKQPFLKQIKFQSYLYTLYNPLNQSFRLELDGTLNYRSVGIIGRASLGTAPPYFAPYIGTRVTIK